MSRRDGFGPASDVGSLNVLDLRLMALIAAYPDRQAPVSELSGPLGVTPSAITKAAIRLNADKLLTQRVDRRDKRRVWLAVTLKGFEQVRRFTTALDRCLGPSYADSC
jgi:DNA-binding MarR family transcriptional regulator